MSDLLLISAAILAFLHFHVGTPRVGVVVAVALAGLFFNYVLWILFGAVAYHLVVRPPGPRPKVKITRF